MVEGGQVTYAESQMILEAGAVCAPSGGAAADPVRAASGCGAAADLIRAASGRRAATGTVCASAGCRAAGAVCSAPAAAGDLRRCSRCAACAGWASDPDGQPQGSQVQVAQQGQVIAGQVQKFQIAQPSQVVSGHVAPGQAAQGQVVTYGALAQTAFGATVGASVAAPMASSGVIGAGVGSR